MKCLGVDCGVSEIGRGHVKVRNKEQDLKSLSVNPLLLAVLSMCRLQSIIATIVLVLYLNALMALCLSWHNGQK